MKQTMAQTQDSNIRTELLRLCADYCIRTGFTHFSLRALAKEIGTSHRMLIYYFGTGDGLFRAILEELRARQIARFVDEFGSVKTMTQFRSSLRRLWAHLASRRNRNYMISYLEIQIAAIRGTENRENSRYLAATLEVWLEPIFSTLVRLGFSHRDSRVLARMVLSGGRGLLLDSLGAGNTADEKEVERSFGRLTELIPGPRVQRRRASVGT
jgi:AcrR family transcriptional regulator